MEAELAAVPATAERATAEERPRLVFFYGKTSGPSRRVDAFLSQVLQRRRNHDTFRLVRVCAETSPHIVERFHVTTIPAIVVIEGARVKARLEDPRHCSLLEAALAPWLR